MKSFTQFLESKNLTESSDSILDGLIKKVKEEYDDTSMLILADYLERIGRVQDSQTIRDNVEDKEEPPQVVIANILGEKLPKNDLYYEMRNFLVKQIKRTGGTVNNVTIEAAIRWFACEYHGGQGSDLYSICSTSAYKPGYDVESIEDEDNDEIWELHQDLVMEYLNVMPETEITDIDDDD